MPTEPAITPRPPDPLIFKGSSTAARQALPSLIGLTRDQLAAALAAIPIPETQINMRLQQIWNALYVHGLSDFATMTTLPRELRSVLAENFTCPRPAISSKQVSVDGTIKWLLRLNDGQEIETVFIPQDTRGTLCLSSQVGCTLTCSFCHTGTQRLVRNLTADEMIGQLMIARDSLGEWPTPRRGRRLTNVVLMGMGEPLYNFDNVRDAVAVLSDGAGLSLSKRRITLSTSGVVPEIVRAGEEIGTMLAISLHAVNNETRNKLIPLNKKYPIEQLLDACRNYPGLSNARRITFEYVMLEGINDTLQDAKDLVALLKHIPAKINLIPFNPWPNSPYQCSNWDQIERFAEVVNKAGYAAPVRTPRGRDIMAACGQLKSESVKIRNSVARTTPPHPHHA